MEIAETLTETIGPRLTGSPQMKRANGWTRDELAGWGLDGARLESFAFGRGWSFSGASVHLMRPAQLPRLALPFAWTPGTNGAVRGEAMRVDIRFRRHSDEALAKLMTTPVPEDDRDRSAFLERRRKRYLMRHALHEFLTDEKAAAIDALDRRGGERTALSVLPPSLTQPTGWAMIAPALIRAQPLRPSPSEGSE